MFRLEPVRKQKKRVRSAPLYIETGGRIVSLVAEGEIKGKAVRIATPVAVYVIDQGVSRIDVPAHRRFTLTSSLCVVAPRRLQGIFCCGKALVSPNTNTASTNGDSVSASEQKRPAFFGEAYQTGDKTLVPLMAVRLASGQAKAVAIIEISSGKVRIRPFMSLPTRRRL